MVLGARIRTSPLGGRDLTAYLASMLESCTTDPYSAQPLRRRLGIARAVKERHAYVADDFAREVCSVGQGVGVGGVDGLVSWIMGLRRLRNSRIQTLFESINDTGDPRGWRLCAGGARRDEVPARPDARPVRCVSPLIIIKVFIASVFSYIHKPSTTHPTNASDTALGKCVLVPGADTSRISPRKDGDTGDDASIVVSCMARLPDGSALRFRVGKERFHCPELLFDPTLFGGDGEGEEDGGGGEGRDAGKNKTRRCVLCGFTPIFSP